MIQDDIDQFEEMIADCYLVSVGTKRTIEITKEAFRLAGVELGPNNIFYEIESNVKTEKALVLIDNKKLKIEILKHLHII